MLALKGKKIGVLGLGTSGLAAVEYLHQQGAQVYVLSKGEPSTWPHFDRLQSLDLGKNCFSDRHYFPSEVAAVILSPGISRQHRALRKLKNVPIINEIELAWPTVQAPVIAVTGSNGKTTTVSLVTALLRGMGKKVFLGGNIGTPLCTYALNPTPVDYFVLELSSFQLESLREFHPQVAVILNVVANHGERYKTVDAYLAAKWQITHNLSGHDTFIYPQNLLERKNALPLPLCARVALDLDDGQQALAELSTVWDLKEFKLPGQHNLLNLYFCYHILKALNLPLAKAQKALAEFTGVEYRVSLVPTPLPFKAFNDAKSTNWHATAAAIVSAKAASDPGRPLWLIIGGQRRGRHDDLAPWLERFIAQVDKFILIGDTTEEYYALLQGRAAVQRAYDLATAVRHVLAAGFTGTLLFSPGLPSFDQYPNYVARGKDFATLLAELGPQA